jgi:hypothetical protein
MRARNMVSRWRLCDTRQEVVLEKTVTGACNRVTLCLLKMEKDEKGCPEELSCAEFSI